MVVLGLATKWMPQTQHLGHLLSSYLLAVIQDRLCDSDAEDGFILSTDLSSRGLLTATEEENVISQE